MNRKLHRSDVLRSLRAIAPASLFTPIFVSCWPIEAAVALPIPYISDEVGFNNATSRSQVEAQDDAWRSAAMATGSSNFFQNTISPGSNNEPVSPDSYTLMTTVSGVSVQVSLHDVTDADISNPRSLGMLASGSPRLDNTSTLQGSAPRPASFYNTNAQLRFWNENTGSTTSRNAVLFEFSEPVTAFGAWFADVETRTDGNGTPAILRLLDESGNRIGNDIIIDASVTDQSQCGSPSATFPTSDDNFRGCGNRTTRWIGFADPDAQVKQMLVVVGDDDFGDQGDREHLSFIGATLLQPVASDPNLILVKRITAINGVSFTDVVDGRRDLDPNAPTYGDDPTVAYVPAPYDTHDNHPDWPLGYLKGVIDQQVVHSGDEIEYTIYFLSNGDATARNVRLCDPIPSSVSFLPTPFNGGSGAGGTPGADQGIMLSRHSGNVFLSNLADGDSGAFFSSVSDVPIACGAAQLEDNGAIVVNLGDIPDAANDPTNAYGFIRFRGRVE